MTDIVERLAFKQGFGTTLTGDEVRELYILIESLRQQLVACKQALAECKEQLEWANAMNSALNQSNLECLAREKVLRRRCEYFESVSTGFEIERINELTPVPQSDSTALYAALRKAKRKALLEAAEDFEQDKNEWISRVATGAKLRRMAEELK